MSIRYLLPAALLTCILLAGCSTTTTQERRPTSTNSWRTPLKSAKKVAVHTARGNMNFVCAYDAKGFYWRFSHPSGALYKEKTKIAVLNPDWSITTLKGVVLKASISANAPRSNARDLQDALFTAIPHTKGLFEGIRYIERRHATGGLPLTRCSASQLGQRLARPFEAQYVFWR